MQASEVQVWVARPSAFGPAASDALRRLLDEDERARGGRLRNEADRHAHLVAHGLCRTLLGQLLDQAPQALRFARDAHGKPSLRGVGAELGFSLSHTRGLVVCAASVAGPLGIDVEAIDPDAADRALLDLFVQPSGATATGASEPEAFYTSWTALEAYWKARGTGLSTANPRLRLERAEGRLQASLEGDASGASRLFITPVDAEPGFAVALACRWVPTLQVRQWHPNSPEGAQKCDKRSFVFRDSEITAAFS